MAFRISHVAAFREFAKAGNTLIISSNLSDAASFTGPLGPPRPRQMRSLVLSTIAFFVATYFIRRYPDEMEIPRTMTRGIVVFALAPGVSYRVAFLVGLL